MKTITTERKEHTMKNTKRKIFVAALAISLVAIISMGSLAWFSGSDSVKNNFMVATSTDDQPEDVFSVDVYEVKPDGTKEQTGLSYTDVLPGDQLEKKAHVANTGYYDQYIRVIVTISDAPAWQAMLGTGFNDTTLLSCFEGFNQSKWNHITTEVYNKGTTDNAADDVIRIVMYYNDVLEGDHDSNPGDITVFTGVNIPSVMTQTHAVLFDDDSVEGFTIDVLAQAVQTENVVPDGTAAGSEAYAAFGTVGMTY